MKQATHTINVRLPIPVHEALKQLAKQQDRSVSWLVNKVLEGAVELQLKSGQQ